VSAHKLCLDGTYEVTNQRLQLHPIREKVREVSLRSSRRSATYSSIPSFCEYPLTGPSGQRLGAGYHAIGTMDHTPPTWEGYELGIGCWVDGFRVERHDEGAEQQEYVGISVLRMEYLPAKGTKALYIIIAVNVAQEQVKANQSQSQRPSRTTDLNNEKSELVTKLLPLGTF